MAYLHDFIYNENSNCRRSSEAVVKAVASAVANQFGTDLAVKILPTVTAAVVGVLDNGDYSASVPFLKEGREIVRAGRILGALGYMAGASGNISVRLDDGTVLITPSGMRKIDLHPDDMVRVDLAGNVLSEGPYKVSSEYMIHLQAYRSRNDVRAVVHTHAPYATTFAAAHMPLDNTVLAEAWNMLGGTIPVVPFGAPSTPELASNLIPFLKDHSCFLLENHGLMTIAKDLETAVQMTETAEFLAKIQINARALGGEKPLRGDSIRILREVQAKRCQK
ncbi:class II aldolase/adducin family protein [bacterium]|nr:class II aldolase/adducin family protein [bacterium]